MLSVVVITRYKSENLRQMNDGMMPNVDGTRGIE